MSDAIKQGVQVLRDRAWAFPLLLLALIAITYAPNLNNEFLYDDIELVVNRPAAKNVGEVFSVFAKPHWHNLAYYRPVAGLSMAVQKTLHGNNPVPFHLFNIAVMMAAALCAYALLRLPQFSMPRDRAFIVAALFALHPLASSCVYPVCSGRETLLPGLFILVSLWCWLRGSATWAIAAMTLGLFSKEQAIIIPVLFVLADRMGLSPYQGGALKRYLPQLGIIVGYFIARHFVFLNDIHAPVALALLEHPIGPLQTIGYFLQTIFAPYVELRYEPRVPIWFCPGRMAAAVVVLAALVWRYLWPIPFKDKRFWWLILFAGLAAGPTANVLSQEAKFAERYLWLSFLVVPAILLMFAKRMNRFDGGLFTLLIVVCCVISFSRDRAFSDYQAFLQQWVQVDPDSLQPHLSLGDLRLREQRYAEAVPHYLRALELEPKHATVLNNLGSAYNGLGDYADAEDVLERVIGFYPDDWAGQDNLGISYFQQGKLDEAAAMFERAVELNDKAYAAMYNLGVIAEQREQPEVARAWFEKSIEANPAYVNPYQSLGVYYFRKQEMGQAVDYFNRAINVHPRAARAHYGLSVIAATQGRMTEAIRHCQDALAIQPNYPEAQMHMQRLLQDPRR